MQVIEDIGDKLKAIMNRKFCIVDTCFTARLIVQGINAMLNLVFYPVELAITAIFRAFGFDCYTMDECLDSIIDKYIGKIPGLDDLDFSPLDFRLPEVPTLDFPDYF